jgi:hypothetical protein
LTQRQRADLALCIPTPPQRGCFQSRVPCMSKDDFFVLILRTKIPRLWVNAEYAFARRDLANPSFVHISASPEDMGWRAARWGCQIWKQDRRFQLEFSQLLANHVADRASAAPNFLLSGSFHVKIEQMLVPPAPEQVKDGTHQRTVLTAT